jgi:DNA mismatch endonuclease, patch repair protein
MSRIRGADTRPEEAVRGLLRSLGFRPQLNRRNLPGVPDLVLPGRKLVFFVHGCFWHRHARCRYAYTPKSNVLFWRAKFRANVARDRLVRVQLSRLGWRVVVVWECELRLFDRLRARMRNAVKRQSARRQSRPRQPSV